MVRALILASLAWLAIAAASPPQQRRGQLNTVSQDAAANSVQNGAAAPTETHNEAASYTAYCEQARDNRHSDLCAQWKAADAARDSADWTQRTFYLGIGGLILGLGTLGAAIAAAWFARAAAHETKRSADFAGQMAVEAASATAAAVEASKAGLEANRIARNAHARADMKERWEARARRSREDAAAKITEQQLRAYLSVRNAMAMGINPERLPTFGIEIKNQGQTPAYDVRIRSATMWTTEGPESARIHFTEPSKMGTMSGGDDRTYRSRTAENAWPPGLYEAVMSGKAALVYCGLITYRDVFRKLRRTTFMGYFEVHDIVNGSAVLSLTKRGNRAT